MENVQGFALLDTGASRTVGGHTMVQHVIDSLRLQQTPTWMESAEPAVNFTFAGGEQAHSGTKVWLPLQGTDSEQFSVYVVLSEATPILFGLDMIRGVWSRDRCLTLTVSQHSISGSTKTSFVRDASGRISINTGTASSPSSFAAMSTAQHRAWTVQSMLCSKMVKSS